MINETTAMLPPKIGQEHLSRRAFLKGALATAGGLAVANWGGLFHSQSIAQEAARRNKRCILLWANGGASQLDTFDMKRGRPTSGPFRPMATNVPGIEICEYLPRLSRLADKLAIIRSMRTQSPDHPDGIYHMHTCYRQAERVPYPEIGAMIAKSQRQSRVRPAQLSSAWARAVIYAMPAILVRDSSRSRLTAMAGCRTSPRPW